MSTVSIPSLRPESRGRRWIIADIAVQIAHRAAILGLFAFLGALTLLYTGGSAHWAIAAMFICADLGCCAAVLARSLLRPSALRREATGVLLFSAAMLLLSLQLMLLTRLALIRSAAAAFFTPS